MKTRAREGTFDHSGSSFDSFLDEEGIREEVEGVAVKRVLAWQLESAMRRQQKTKRAMARELHTSRSQLDRLLDPQNASVSLDTITRAARALGKRVIIQITDARGPRTKHEATGKARSRSVSHSRVTRRNSSRSGVVSKAV